MNFENINNDRLTSGFFAGLLAGIFLNIYNLFFYHVLGLVKIRFIDWASILILGARPINSYEFIYSLLLQLIWDGFLGIIFTFLITLVTSKNYLLKAVIYTFTLNFFFRSLAIMFDLPFVSEKVPVTTNAINLIGTMIWGVIMAKTTMAQHRKSVE